MASLSNQTIGSSYEQLLHVNLDGGGTDTDLVEVLDGDNGTTFGFKISTNALMMNTNNQLQFRDTAIYIYSSADTQLDIVADAIIQVTAPTVNIEASTAITLESDAITLGEGGAADIVLTFDTDGNDGVITWMDSSSEDYFKFDDSILIIDDKKLIFGTDSDVSIEYDEDGENRLRIEGAPVVIAGGEGESGDLHIYADQGDDAGDEWKISVADAGVMTFGNDIASAGTYVTHFTITPHATITSSTVAFAGSISTAASVTVGTTLIPNASGGADIGSTTAEWGDVFIADDKKIKFGSDQDVTMEYDTGTQDALLIEGGDIVIADDLKLYFGTDKDAYIKYDEDGSDKWQFSPPAGGILIRDDKKLIFGTNSDFTIEYDEDGEDTTAIVAANGVSFAPHNTSSGNTTELRFQELAANASEGSVQYVGFKAPDAIAANKVWVLPIADGSGGQVLSTDGSLALSWISQVDTSLEAGSATNVEVDTTTNATCSVALFESTTGTIGAKTDAGLTYNATTNALTIAGPTSIAGATSMDSTLTVDNGTAGDAGVGAIYTTGGIGTGGNSYIGGNLTVNGNLAADSVTGDLSAAIQGIDYTGTIVLNASENIKLDADDNNFIFSVGNATTGDTNANELMRITWGNGSTEGEWDRDLDKHSVIRIQHTAKVENVSGDAGMAKFMFTGVDVNDFDSPSAGALGEIGVDGFIGYGKHGNSGMDNLCLGNGKISTGASGNVLMNYGATYDYSDTKSVFIGYRAAWRRQSGKYCVIIGADANYNNTSTGDDNTCIGRSSGYSISTAARNTFVGSRCGETATTGGANTLIGYKVDTSTASSTYQIAIGMGASGNSKLNGIDDSVVIGKWNDYITADYTDSGTWTHVSDLRMKENVISNNLGLDFINMLRPVNYTKKSPSEYPQEWKNYNSEATDKDDTVRYGFIAQEVKEAMDKFGADYFSGWTIEDDGKQGVGFASFVVPLVKAVQELSAKVEHLEANNKTVTHIN